MEHRLVSTTGEIVLPARMLRAVEGPHAGTWWRLERLITTGADHLVHVTRKHAVGRVHRHFMPSVFGLTVERVLTRMERVTGYARHGWARIDDGLILGVLALLPLAFFEKYHLAEYVPNIAALFGGGGH